MTPQTPHPDAASVATPLRHFSAGHAMRGLGALMVLVAHVPGTELIMQIVGMPDPAGRDIYGLFGGRSATFGIFGLSMILNAFFVLSAYLLGRQFVLFGLGAWDRPSVWRYGIRRVLRIWPAFLVVVLGVLLVWGREGEPWANVWFVASLQDQVTGRPGPFSLRLSHTWTVSLEVWFYVLLPIAGFGWAAAARRWGWRGVFGGLGVGTVVLLALAVAEVRPAPLAQLWRFLPGLWLAAVELHRPSRAVITRALVGRRNVPAIVLGLLILCSSAVLQAEISVIAGGSSTAAGFGGMDAAWMASVLVGSSLLVAALLAPEWDGRRVTLRLDARWLQAVGDRSYVLYLVHFPVLLWLQPRFATDHRGYGGLLMVGLAGLVISFLITEVLHRLVERPALGLSGRLTRRAPAASVTAAPGAEGAVAGATPEPAAPPAEPDPEPALREIRSGGAIRGLSALAVFSWHAIGISILLSGALTSPLYDVSDQIGPILGVAPQLGIAGVLCFFCLSGFLITRPFVSAATAGTAWPDAPRYVLRRVLRIYPVFLVVLLAVLLVRGTGGADGGLVVRLATLWTPLGGGAQPGGLDQLGHAWSLHVEMAAYLVLPAAIVLVGWILGPVRGHRSGRGLALAGLAILAGVLSVLAGADVDLPRNFGPALAAFVPGVLLAIVDVGGALDRWAATDGRRRAGLAAAAGVVLVLAAMTLGSLVGAGDGGAGVSVYGKVLGVGLLVLAALLWERATSRPPALLRLAPVVWLGKVSYPFYLVHLPLQWAVAEWLMEHTGLGWIGLGAVVFVVTLGPACAIAYALHRLVERPAMRFGHRVPAPRVPGADARLAAAAGASRPAGD